MTDLPNPSEQSRFTHYSDFSVQTRLIYLLAGGTLLATLIALPVIRVDVSIHTSGMIRPEVERTVLHAPMSGMIQSLPIPERSRVKAGDTLLTFRPEGEPLQQSRIEGRLREIDRQLSDLNRLESADQEVIETGIHNRLQSVRYRRSLLEFRQRIRQAERGVRRARSSHHRSRILAERDLISQEELEESRFHYQESTDERLHLHRHQIYQWTIDREQLQTERRELTAHREELQKKLDNHVVTAPLNAHLHNLHDLQPGSFLSVNQPVAELLPESRLIAELHLSPERAGIIETGMDVRIRLHAFDEREWGTLNGTVISIADDITLEGNRAYFRVQCRLERNWLKLPGGVRRPIKSGMTLQAQLHVAERTLLQLLFDRMDNWLNPYWDSTGPNEPVNGSLSATAGNRS